MQYQKATDWPALTGQAWDQKDVYSWCVHCACSVWTYYLTIQINATFICFRNVRQPLFKTAFPSHPGRTESIRISLSQQNTTKPSMVFLEYKSVGSVFSTFMLKNSFLSPCVLNVMVLYVIEFFLSCSNSIWEAFGGQQPWCSLSAC